jgi:elongation factor P hydroxylase
VEDVMSHLDSADRIEAQGGLTTVLAAVTEWIGSETAVFAVKGARVLEGAQAFFVSMWDFIKHAVSKAFAVVTNAFEQLKLCVITFFSTIKIFSAKGLEFFVGVVKSVCKTTGKPGPPDLQTAPFDSVDKKTECQADDSWYHSVPAYFLGCVGMFADALSSILSIVESSAPKLSAYASSIAKVFKSLAGIGYVAKGLDVATFALDWIYCKITGSHCFTAYDDLARFDKACQEARELLKQKNIKNPSKRFFEDAARVSQELQWYYTLVIEHFPAHSASYRTRFQAVADKLLPLSETYESATRLKPVVVCMRGKSGCGKTTATNTLRSSLYAHMCSYIDPDDLREDVPLMKQHAADPTYMNINCSGPKHVYDDGYHNQAFYVLDEYGTSKSAENKTDWAVYLMRIMNSEPLLLNMAFGDKGKRYFNSPFILATGNFESHTVPFEDPLAFHRRIEFDLIVTRNSTEKFHLNQVRFNFSTECIAAYLSDKTPSAVITKLHEQGTIDLTKSFGFATLLNMVSLAYMDRVCTPPPDYREDIVVKPFDYNFKTARNMSHILFGEDVMVEDVKPSLPGRANATKFQKMSAKVKAKVSAAAAAMLLALQRSTDKNRDYVRGHRKGGPDYKESDFARFRREKREKVSEVQEEDLDPEDPFGCRDKGKDKDSYSEEEDETVSLSQCGDEAPLCAQGGDVNGVTGTIKDLYVFIFSKNPPNWLPFSYADCKPWFEIENIILDFGVKPTKWTYDTMLRGLTKMWPLHHSRAMTRNFVGVNPYVALRYLLAQINGLREYGEVNFFKKSPQELLQVYADSWGAMNARQRSYLRKQGASMDIKIVCRWTGAKLVPGKVGADPKLVERRRQNYATNGTKQVAATAKRNAEFAGGIVPPKPKQTPKPRVQRAAYVTASKQGRADRSKQKALTRKRAMERIEKQACPGYLTALADTMPQHVRDSAIARRNLELSNYIAANPFWKMGMASRSHVPVNFVQLVHYCVHSFSLNRTTMSDEMLALLGLLTQKPDLDVDIPQPTALAIYDFMTESPFNMEEKILTAYAVGAASFKLQDMRDYYEFFSSGRVCKQTHIAQGVLYAVIHYAHSAWNSRNMDEVAKNTVKNEFNKLVVSKAGPDYGLLFKGIAVIVGGVAFNALWIAGLVKLISFMNGTKEVSTLSTQDLEKEIERRGGIVIEKQSFDKEKEKLIKPPNVPSFDAIASQNGNDNAVVTKVLHNMYLVRSMTGSVAGILTFMFGSVATIPRHVWEMVRGRETLTLMPLLKPKDGDIQLQKFAMCQVRILSDNNEKDVVILGIESARPHSNITSLMLTEEEYVKNRSFSENIMLTFAQDTGSAETGLCEPVGNASFILEKKNMNTVDPLKPLMINGYLTYKWSTNARSRCGSILMSKVKGTMRIVGSHAAAQQSSVVAYGTTLFRDWYTQYRLTSASSPSVIATVGQCGLDYVDDDADNVYSMIVPGLFKVNHRSDPTIAVSSFKPTAFQDFAFKGGSPKLPAVTSKEAYFLAVAKEKESNRVHHIGPAAAVVIRDHRDLLIEQILPGPRSNYTGCRTLTTREALDHTLDERFPAWDKNSSKGVRLRLWKLSKKRILEDLDSPEGQEFCARCDDIMDRMRQGDFTYQVCCDKLKEELRDPERVALMKTRIFNVTDFVDNVIIKRCIGDLVGRMKFLFGRSYAACGVNPSSMMWTYWYNHFSEDLPTTFADVKGWDHIVTPVLLSLLWDICQICYPDRFEAVLAFYALHSCVYGLRAAYGYARMNGRGNTSGNWVTTFLNTLCNLIYFSIATIVIAKKEFNVPAREAVEQLLIKLYSDDNIVQNQRLAITTKMYSIAFDVLFGVTLTGTDKGDVTEDTLQTGEFISRGFVKENGIVYAPLTMPSLVSQLYFVRVPANSTEEYFHEQVQANISNVCRGAVEWRKEGQKLVNDMAVFVGEHKLPYHVDFDFVRDYVLTKEHNL